MALKLGTDNMREAPSAIIASRLLAEVSEVGCWDPTAVPQTAEPWTSTTRHETLMEEMDDVDAAAGVSLVGRKTPASSRVAMIIRIRLMDCSGCRS